MKMYVSQETHLGRALNVASYRFKDALHPQTSCYQPVDLLANKSKTYDLLNGRNPLLAGLWFGAQTPKEGTAVTSYRQSDLISTCPLRRVTPRHLRKLALLERVKTCIRSQILSRLWDFHPQLHDRCPACG